MIKFSIYILLQYNVPLDLTCPYPLVHCRAFYTILPAVIRTVYTKCSNSKMTMQPFDVHFHVLSLFHNVHIVSQCNCTGSAICHQLGAAGIVASRQIFEDRTFKCD